MLALCALYSPVVANQVDAWLKKRFKSRKKYKGPLGCLPKKHRVTQTCCSCKRTWAATPLLNRITYTSSDSDKVVIPPGWLHQVVNKLPCIKMARDFYVMGGLVDYVSNWQHVGQPLLGEQSTPDYTNFMAFVSQALEGHPCALGCRCKDPRKV